MPSVYRMLLLLPVLVQLVLSWCCVICMTRCDWSMHGWPCFPPAWSGHVPSAFSNDGY